MYVKRPPLIDEGGLFAFGYWILDLLPNKESGTIMGISSIQGDAHDYRFDRA